MLLPQPRLIIMQLTANKDESCARTAKSGIVLRPSIARAWLGFWINRRANEVAARDALNRGKHG